MQFLRSVKNVQEWIVLEMLKYKEN
jgi:hypothetical protein